MGLCLFGYTREIGQAERIQLLKASGFTVEPMGFGSPEWLRYKLADPSLAESTDDLVRPAREILRVTNSRGECVWVCIMVAPVESGVYGPMLKDAVDDCPEGQVCFTVVRAGGTDDLYRKVWKTLEHRGRAERVEDALAACGCAAQVAAVIGAIAVFVILRMRSDDLVAAIVSAVGIGIGFMVLAAAAFRLNSYLHRRRRASRGMHDGEQ